MIDKQTLISALETVKDPEIPTVSIVDLGIITDVNISNEKVHVVMTPTFVGCPAIDVMRNDVESVLKGLQLDFTLDVNYDIPWDSNRVTEKGKAALKAFGLAPPPHYDTILDLDILYTVPCPYCNSTDTKLENPFGPTLCRSIHYCNTCMQAFEQFKPV